MNTVLRRESAGIKKRKPLEKRREKSNVCFAAGGEEDAVQVAIRR